MKSLKLNNSSGDTIVEVLIVLAVLSLSFAISYATANAGTSKAQNAQEHSQALGYINSQVELLRTAITKDNSAVFGTTDFCIDDTANPKNASAVIAVVDPYPTQCLKQDRYKVSIKYISNPIPSKSYFQFIVDWDGIGSLGPQKENLTYKMQQLAYVGLAAGNPYQGGPIGEGYSENKPPIVPPVVPPIDPPAVEPSQPVNWLINGADYASCNIRSSDTGLWADGSNSCSRDGTAMYTYRAADINYQFDAGTYIGRDQQGVNAGTYMLTIKYSQYRINDIFVLGGSDRPPSNYKFSISIKIDDDTVGTIDLPIESNSTSYDLHTARATINVPLNAPSGITLSWTNNSYSIFSGGNPNLKIYSVGLQTDTSGAGSGAGLDVIR